MVPRQISRSTGVAVVCVLLLGCGVDEPSEEGTLTSVGLRTPNSPLVSLRIAFRTGSVNDPAGKHGLNALTAAMIRAGWHADVELRRARRGVVPVVSVDCGAVRQGDDDHHRGSPSGPPRAVLTRFCAISYSRPALMSLTSSGTGSS